jgi:hypothetical protein
MCRGTSVIPSLLTLKSVSLLAIHRDTRAGSSITPPPAAPSSLSVLLLKHLHTKYAEDNTTPSNPCGLTLCTTTTQKKSTPPSIFDQVISIELLAGMNDVPAVKQSELTTYFGGGGK